jgi:hypothetical protein
MLDNAYYDDLAAKGPYFISDSCAYAGQQLGPPATPYHAAARRRASAGRTMGSNLQ